METNELRKKTEKKSIREYFPEHTPEKEINTVVLKLLKERREIELKKASEKVQTEKKAFSNTQPAKQEENQKPILKKKQFTSKEDNKKNESEKTCSFCKQKGHQRSKCPKKLYPGLNIE